MMQRRRLKGGRTVTMTAEQFNTIIDALYATNDVVEATGNDDEEPEASAADIFEMVCNIGISVGEAIEVVDEIFPIE